MGASDRKAHDFQPLQTRSHGSRKPDFDRPTQLAAGFPALSRTIPTSVLESCLLARIGAAWQDPSAQPRTI